ncbi:hypothetical protein FACS189413_16580 [Bacteroidia bacterium]|nr:hypothetical protein FACS189413_16580 [Bacteroidia bacterium]
MNKVNIFLIPVLTIFLSIHLQAADYPIIPYPQQLTPQKGYFTLDNQTNIVSDDFSEEEIKAIAGSWPVEIITTPGFSGKKAIILQHNNKIDHPEAYTMDISTQKILIQANSPKGCFYAMQTLRQLLSPQFDLNKAPVSIPCCKIKDHPKYGYRGMHLDVCRHFAPVEEIKTLIDQISFLKINTFHWHLTDDQGWRIEIKKYPLLTQTGAYRNRTIIGHPRRDIPHKFDQTVYGGFYTQEQIREVVEYAASKFVDVLPEIEMPGHAMAALAAYPQYSCSGGPFEVAGTWGVFNDVFCPKDSTFIFLQNILDEVIALFPYPYIHVGGDECPVIRWKNCVHCQKRIAEEGLKDEHELEDYFVRRIENYLKEKGKKIVGWEEILNPNLNPTSRIMSWRGEKTGIKASKMGYDVIMTPDTYLYLDYHQSKSDSLKIGPYLPVEKVYSYNPASDSLNKEEAKHIAGVQANVWTEYMSTPQRRQEMIFPRIAALSEIAWLDANFKDYERFSQNLKQYMQQVQSINKITNLNHYGVQH